MENSRMKNISILFLIYYFLKLFCVLVADFENLLTIAIETYRMNVYFDIFS